MTILENNILVSVDVTTDQRVLNDLNSPLNLESTTIIGGDFSNYDPVIERMVNCTLEYSNLNSANLANSSIRENSIKMCSLDSSDFSEANLYYTEFKFCDLLDINVNGAEISDCDFKGSVVIGWQGNLATHNTDNGNQIELIDTSNAITTPKDLIKKIFTRDLDIDEDIDKVDYRRMLIDAAKSLKKRKEELQIDDQDYHIIDTLSNLNDYYTNELAEILTLIENPEHLLSDITNMKNQSSLLKLNNRTLIGTNYLNQETTDTTQSRPTKKQKITTEEKLNFTNLPVECLNEIASFETGNNSYGIQRRALAEYTRVIDSEKKQDIYSSVYIEELCDTWAEKIDSEIEESYNLLAR